MPFALVQELYGAYTPIGGAALPAQPLDLQLTVPLGGRFLRDRSAAVHGVARASALGPPRPVSGRVRLALDDTPVRYDLDLGEYQLDLRLQWQPASPFWSLSTFFGTLRRVGAELMADVQLRFDYRRDLCSLLRRI